MAALGAANSVAWAQAPAAVRDDENRRIDVFQKAARAVVCIFGTPERGGGGSGVVIDRAGYGLTNFHVVQEFVETRHGYGGLADGKLYRLTVLGIDPGGDVVLFKLDGRESFDFAPLANSDELRVGDWVAAMGNPFLVAEDFSPTITLGIVSGLHRYQEGQGNLLEYADCIQVSTSINPGNSGGPLFDMQGRVLGINGRASFEERGRVNVGLGYAVTANQIRRFLPGFFAGRLMYHGTLGATVQQLGDDLVFNAIQGLSPADKAGIALGDKLIAVGGRRMRTPNDFNNAIAILPAEWPVSLTVLHDGKERQIAARLERLSLRLPMSYLPDLEINQRELARFFDAATRRERPGSAQSADWSVEWRQDAANAAARELHLRIDLTAAGESQTPADICPDAPEAAEAWMEWRLLTRPLLGARTFDPDWELIGGDEREGRIICVAERRLPGEQKVRWCFDLGTHELAAVEFLEKGEKRRAVWTASDPAPMGGLRWPAKWRREAADGTAALLRVENLALANGAAASKPVQDAGTVSP
ncbi:MAG: trypsin-like peptidase domain-containing protein [Planctomycetes bacterium]|nr:trypsin-like peptidase domain-containing protein [Planctomycetota bacterium]